MWCKINVRNIWLRSESKDGILKCNSQHYLFIFIFNQLRMDIISRALDLTAVTQRGDIRGETSTKTRSNQRKGKGILICHRQVLHSVLEDIRVQSCRTGDICGIKQFREEWPWRELKFYSILFCLTKYHESTPQHTWANMQFSMPPADGAHRGPHWQHHCSNTVTKAKTSQGKHAEDELFGQRDDGITMQHDTVGPSTHRGR